MTGISAEVRIEEPSVCQVAELSSRCDSISSITRSAPGETETVTEEFVVQGETDLHWSGDPEAEPIFSQNDRTVYRFSRETGQGCVCEIAEQSGCTVRQVRAVDGSLVVTFYAKSLETVRSVVADLREAHDGIEVRRLTRSGEDDNSTAIISLDALTDRQYEVLGAAYEHGYFEFPRGGNAADVAESLDIAVPTFTEHLAAAQRNLLNELLDCDRRSVAVEETA